MAQQGGWGGGWADEAWQIRWLGDGLFKIELEEQGITDRNVREWGGWMDWELDKAFPNGRWPNLTIAHLNMSRNELSDDGIGYVMDYLSRRDINVQVMRFFRNQICDDGAKSIGKFVVSCRNPVQEIHLSHNYIGDEGLLALFHAVANSGRYPCIMEKSGLGGKRNLKLPLWMRLEMNCIQWESVHGRLSKVPWIAAENPEAQAARESGAAICLQYSYRNQQAPSAGAWREWQHSAFESGKGKPAWASPDEWTGEDGSPSLAGISAASHAYDRSRKEAFGPYEEQDRHGSPDAKVVPPRVYKDSASGETTAKEEDVPTYIFLDASATWRFMDMPQEGLFSFPGLLNLCHQGMMYCSPPNSDAQGVEEGNRVIFVVLRYVLEELLELCSKVPGDMRRLEWLRNDPKSYLHLGHEWGILEVIDSLDTHTQLMKLTPSHEKAASEIGISPRMVKVLDFACLWEAQIESEGNVLFLTADKVMHKFGQGVCEFNASTGSKPGKSLTVVHAEELDQRCAADTRFGGKMLCRATKAPIKCDAMLSASLVHSIVRDMLQHPAEGKDNLVQHLRIELKEAVALCNAAKQLLTLNNARTGDSAHSWEVTSCVDSMNKAERRWMEMLSLR